MDCKSCKESRGIVEPIPYIAHESDMARMERTIKRLWVLLILMAFFLIGTNAAWIWHESQFEDVTTTEIEQKADNYSSNYIVGGDFNGSNAED